MRVLGTFRGAGRSAVLSMGVFCLACVSQAAVPEASAQPENTGEYRAVVDRLVRLERELNDLQRATYSRLAARRTGPRTTTDGGYAPSPGTDQQRINDLEAALRSLTGRLEQLEYQMRQLDSRVQRLADSSGAAGLRPPQTMAGAPSASRPQPDGQPPALGAPENLATKMPRQSGEAGAAPPPSARPGAPVSAPGATSTGPASSGPAPASNTEGGPKLSGDEGKDFNTARDLLLRGEFARAGELFGAIVKAYPKSKLAGDSQFWKAESLFVRELYRDAAEAYLVVARDFPDSAKAPDSLVKLSLSFDKLGERKQACAALSQLDRRYPKAPERVRQNAERIKTDFSCA